MNFETLMANNGHADIHAIKAMQELSIALMQLSTGNVSGLTLQNNQEANDWNHECVLQVGGNTIRAWIECTSDAENHSGEYRFRLLATVNDTPVSLSLPDPPWVSGVGEAHIDDLIAQLTALESSVVTVAREITNSISA